jgi:hypothetical protein
LEVADTEEEEEEDGRRRNGRDGLRREHNTLK